MSYNTDNSDTLYRVGKFVLHFSYIEKLLRNFDHGNYMTGYTFFEDHSCCYVEDS